MTIRTISALSLALLTVVGCTTLGTTSEPEPAKDASVTADGGNGTDALAAPSAPLEATIGAKGGELENEKIKLTIPAGALAADTKVTIAENGLAPADYRARSPKFQFGPSGTEFTKPVLVVFKVPVTADLTKVKVYWSRKNGAGFDMVATNVAADRTVVGQVTHFSEGFAALPPDTCAVTLPPSDGRSLYAASTCSLFTNSNSMGL